MRRVINRLKRAMFAAGFALATTIAPNPRLAERMLLRLTQDEFAPEDEFERRRWEEWHPLERSFKRPDWFGKPRLTVKQLMAENMRKEVEKRVERLKNERIFDA